MLEELKEKLADDVRSGINRKHVKAGLPDTQAIQKTVVDAVEAIPRKQVVKPAATPPKAQPLEPTLVTEVDWNTGRVLRPFTPPAAPPPVHPLPLVAERILNLVLDPKYGKRIYEVCFFTPCNKPKLTTKEKDELLYKIAVESIKEHGPL